MKFTANFIPYIAFQFGFRHSLALVEPQPDTLTDVALAAFADIEAPLTAFYSSAEAPASFASALTVLEDKLGLAPGTKVDGRSGKPSSLDLRQPVLPGDGVGNGLLWSVGEGISGHGGPESDEEWSTLGVEAVKNWMLDHQTDLQIDASELFPSRNLFDTASPPAANVRTAVHGSGDTIQLSMYRSYNGIPVVGSRATATIKNGNLINVGLEKWGDIPKGFNTQPRLREQDAYDAIAIKTGLALTGEITCKPELQIITLSTGDVRTSLRSQFGNGYSHVLVWKVCPKFDGQRIEKMEGLVNAVTGEVLSFQDTVDYLQALGDVFPFSNDKIDARGSLQDGWPMPFMQVGNTITDTGGNYALTGSQTAYLSGPYVQMRDLCGTGYTSPTVFGIAKLTSADGIDWNGMSVSGGTDCSTPGVGTAANTHSSRSGFYELNKVIEIARSRLPSNSWLQSRLNSYMNINSSCNAYFDGDVNFYRSSSQCANTGELAGVFVHEWGHGMDYYDVSIGIAEPSGEGIADIYTALRLHDSCIGRGFFKSGVCNGNGNPCKTCNGVRDIDYLKRVNNSPTTFTWANANCGGQVHCLGYVYSEAVWSLYARELKGSPYNYDDNTAMEIVTRLTYIAAGNIQTWFSGSPPYGGCGANSGYLSFLAADDDNGNLNDGTPHMSAIYKAFNDQEIACNTPARQDSGCTGKPTEAPIVTVQDGNNKATLSWNAVQGASKYQVFRTEGLEQCEQGKVLLGTLDSSVLTYTDSGLANGRKYSYIVIPKGSSESCFGPSSACTSVVPVSGPGIGLNCDNDALIIPVLPGESPAVQSRTCEISGSGGFAGSVNVGCTSSLTGVSCAFSTATVTVSSSPKTVTLSIQATSAAQGAGSITISASSNSLVAHSTIPVSAAVAGGAQLASYDSSYKAPRCLVHGSECSSDNLLNGRGTITGGNELNAPNTIDNCQDGNSGTYHSDESLDKIVVRSGDVSGTGAGELMQAGQKATIIATVYAWGTGGSDSADFYYSTDSSPTWTLIGTKKPSSGGLSEIKIDYLLPEASIHRVRVNFRYNGSVNSCSDGSWDDHDDLVFMVNTGTAATPAPVSSAPSKKPVTPAPVSSTPPKKPTPLPTNSPSKKPTPSPTKKPTNSPSRKPTLSPTKNPTPVPTTKPTNKPSKAPVTSKPTIAPSKKPTAFPTAKPTAAPSKQPTKKPTLKPTNSPTTAKPTNNPSQAPVTSKPTNSPSQAPVTSKPTNSPSQAPVTPKPTNSPSQAPATSKPTLAPSKAPVSSSPSAQPIVATTSTTTTTSTTSTTTTTTTTLVTKSPTPLPTANPSSRPTLPPTSKPTVKPTQAPTSKSPSASPTSLSPITASPVSSPSGDGAQDAIFDSEFAVPRCKSTGSSCSSGDLLNGRNNISGGPEPGQPNTLDGCADGSYGSYHNDESIDKVLVRSGEKDGTGSGVSMEEGGRATIIASIWAWGSGASDTADFFYSADASNPVWQYLGSETPEGGGAQDLMVSYDLPQGPNQAVRVQFRYGGSIGTCTSGSYNDRDDIVFAVAKGTSQPTLAPVKTQPPTEATGGGPQQASYDASFFTARCSVYGSECDSLELLNGRGAMKNGNEPNRPNTIDSCTDGNSGSYHYDESIDRIVVRSGEEDGTGSGVNMVEGGRATIIASVWPWSSGSSDYADFYYRQNSANPQWVYIGTKKPSGSGLQEIKMSYTLPQGINQAVRVNFRYRGLQGANGECSKGSYDDTDDLVFAVKSSPSFTGLVAETAVTEDKPKDITVDAMMRIELTANKKGRRGGSKSSKNAKRA